MHISAPAFTLVALLATGAAFAHQHAPETSSEDDAQQQQQMDDDSAHGYQNPTGVDPDPRMDDHPEPDHEHDEEIED